MPGPGRLAPQFSSHLRPLWRGIATPARMEPDTGAARIRGLNSEGAELFPRAADREEGTAARAMANAALPRLGEVGEENSRFRGRTGGTTCRTNKRGAATPWRDSHHIGPVGKPVGSGHPIHPVSE